MQDTPYPTPATAQPRLPLDADAALRAAVARFRTPSLPRAVWQLASTLGGFVGVCAAMYASLELSYGLTLGLAVVAAGLIVRLFIIQHDCGHSSFFGSRRANVALGRLCGLITFTPPSRIGAASMPGITRSGTIPTDAAAGRTSIRLA